MKQLLSTLIAFSVTLSVSAQSIFRKTYTGVSNLASVQATPDGGYILGGSDVQNTGASNLSLVKTDASGTVQWAKSFGDGNIAETGKKVALTPEGGFLLVGSAVANYTFPFVVKTDANGGVIWAKYFQSLSSVNPSQYINDVVMMPDSGYVFAGSSANSYSFLMRVDKDGNVIWSNCHLSTAVIFNRIIMLTNGEYLAVGSRGNVFFVAHLNATGDLIAGRTYSVMGTEALDVAPTADGNFVFVGKTSSALTAMKTDLGGNVYWSKSYNTGTSYYASVSEIASGSFLMAFYSNSYGDVIMTVDNVGNTPSARYYSGGTNAYADQLHASASGNYVHVTGNQLVKFNSSSTFTCTTTAVTFTATGISPVAVAQTVTYNIVGLSLAPNYYVNSIPVTVASTCGGKCTTADNVSVAINVPDTVCMGRQVTLSYAGVGTVSTYKWTENGVTFATTASPSRYFNVPGTQNLMLVVTNSAGCRDTATKSVYVRGDCGITGNPFNYFSKTYTNYTTAADVRPTADNGFILSGSTSLLGTPDMCIIKTDSNGVVQWGRSYGSGSLNEYATRVRETNDGGFLTIGDENYIFVVKTSATGTFEWQNNYQLISGSSTATSQVVKDAIITPDNGTIIIGSASTNYAMMFKIDQSGAVVWGNNSLGTGATSFNSIAQNSAGNYIITGVTGTTPIVLEINQAGNILWSKQYTIFNGADHILALSDGTYLVVGRYSTTRLAVVKLDAAGNVIWAKYTGTTIGTLTGTGAQEDPDNGVVVTCYGTSYGLVAFKFNQVGNIVDTRYYSGTDNPARVSRTASGAYVVSDGNTLRKFSAFNQISSCNATTLSVTMTAISPVPTNINLTPNAYAMMNNQFYVSSNTNHTLATPCTNTGCNTIAQFISVPIACTNEVVDLVNTSLGGVTYTWNENNVPFSNSFNTTRSFSAPGTYVIRLDVVGPSGCTSSFTINIDVGASFNVTVSPDATIPCGGSTQLNATGGTTYLWSPATGLDNPNIANPVATPSGTTTYTVSIGNGGSCFITRTVTVTVSGTPVITVSGNNEICNGSSTQLTASGATSYTWQPGNLTGSTVTVSPSSNTTYTVTGTSGTCSGTQTVTVTVNQLPVITTSGNTTICNGNQATLTAFGGSTYTWQPGGLTGSSVNVMPSNTTAYTVTGTDANGCTNTTNVTVTVNQLPAVTYNEVNTHVCDSASAITLTPGSPSGGIYSGPGVNGNQFNPTVAGLGTWNIVYSYTDGNGCTNSATQQITVDFCTGLNEPGMQPGIKIYPNPFNANLTIEHPNSFANIRLTNVAGQELMSAYFSGYLSLETRQLSSGIYILEIKGTDSVKQFKVIKE